MNSTYLGYCEEKLQLIKFLGVENAAKWIGERTLSYGFSSSDTIEFILSASILILNHKTAVTVALNLDLVLRKKSAQQFGRTFVVTIM